MYTQKLKLILKKLKKLVEEGTIHYEISEKLRKKF